MTSSRYFWKIIEFFIVYDNEQNKFDEQGQEPYLLMILFLSR